MPKPASLSAVAATAALTLFALALTAVQPVGAAPSTLRVTALEDSLGLTSRLVFSTARGAATPSRAATLSNTGSSPIRVTDITIAGQDAGTFSLAAGQPRAFTIAAHGSTDLRVRYRPTASSNGNHFATLTVVNTSTTPRFDVRLRGVNARGTLGSTEPRLAQLMQLFGYTTNVGFSGLDEATTRAPRGDEVIAPYFVRASTTAPVRMVPIARYTGANTTSGDTGRTAQNSAARQSLFRFPPDQFVDPNPDDGVDSSIYRENQKTFPRIASGATTFTPTSTFGIYGSNANYSDDRYNTDDAGVSFHNVRVYPARGEGGGVLPNSWLLTIDVNTDPPDKNYDYQDQVILLTNAKPALTPGPASVLLSFDPVGGTVPDKDGQGTGFTSIQANKNGTQSQRSLLDITGGRLRITSTVGKNSGSENLQVNALQAGFDGSRSDTSVQARLIGPLTDLASGFQQKAVFFGPDQDNYVKIEAEHRTSPAGVFITVLREQNGATSTIGQVRVANPAAVSTLDLGIIGDLEGGVVRGRYRINGGSWVDLGNTFRPQAVMRFFSPQARAGVLVSHTGSSTPIVGVYDSFAVS